MINEKVKEVQDSTIKEAAGMLKKYRKCLVVRPTGFGKTKIALDIAAKYTHVVFCYPFNNIKNDILSYSIDIKLLSYSNIRGIYKSGKETRTVKCKDHLGNEFESITDMCKHYGITTYMYRNRTKKGWNLEKILITPNKRKTYIDPITLKPETLGHFIDVYVPDMKMPTLVNQIKKYGLLRAVGISVILAPYHINFNITKYGLTVVKRIKKGKDVFECYINNPDGSKTFRIMSYDMIDEYCLNKYKESIKNVCEENTDVVHVN